MVRILKLLVVLLILNGLGRVTSAYWEFYRFRDSVQEAAQFSADKADSDVHDRVMQLAGAASLPVSSDAVQIRREGQHTYIEVYYLRNIELVPMAWTRRWPFRINADAWAVRQQIEQKPLRP